ncbi:MAG: 4Fe-4S dicluster domain-containing protein [Chloroflexi bacterium]|nr:4Fe-4S dicluster domain-containing protein [Chloroflexota bacterium]
MFHLYFGSKYDEMSLETVLAIRLDQTLCDGCGLCVDFCPVKVFGQEDDSVKVAKIEACYACDSCVDLCPRNAIKIIKA